MTGFCRHIFSGLLFLATGVAVGQTAAPAPAAVDTDALKQSLDAIFDDPKWSSARWGIIVHDIESSQTLYERDADKSVMPASNMKLFTTAAALASMGADYRFNTHIYASGTTDTQGVLHGNIMVVGSGDPSISGRYFDTPTTAILAQWASAIKDAGITKINGDIIGDDDVFDDRPVAGTWAVSYMQEWYAAENSGLAINDNCWDILIEPVSTVKRSSGGSGESFEIGTGVSITNPLQTVYYSVNVDNVTVTPASSDGATSEPRQNANLSIDRDPETNVIRLSGTMAEDSAPVKEWGSLDNGTLFAVTLLAEELRRQGVEITGGPVDIDDIDRQVAEHYKQNRGVVVHTHTSPPMSEIIAVINKPSQNFYADMVLKAVGAHVHGEGSWYNGERVVEDLLTTAGVSVDSFNVSDGSGLSRFNMVEPRQVLALLLYMRGRPDFDVYEASLPVMGQDGTLRGRMRGTPAEGNVKAKTGTIGMVRALSGYMTTNSGRPLAFSMIANNYHVRTSEATEAQNAAIMELLELR